VEVDNGTDVQLTHERLPNPVERDNHTHGWMGCFDKLEKLFSPGGRRTAVSAAG